MVFVFAAGNEYQIGDDVNYEGYLNSRFTISVGALGRDLKHASYSSSGAPVFISAPGGDSGELPRHACRAAARSRRRRQLR